MPKRGASPFAQAQGPQAVDHLVTTRQEVSSAMWGAIVFDEGDVLRFFCCLLPKGMYVHRRS